MLLADVGASVVRVDRLGPADADHPVNPVVERGRRSVAVDLKSAEGVKVVLDLVRGADVLLESYRPGVAERLGIGPAACHALNDGWSTRGSAASVRTDPGPGSLGTTSTTSASPAPCGRSAAPVSGRSPR
jgi:alpha-methylacyl-CoA racemase